MFWGGEVSALTPIEEQVLWIYACSNDIYISSSDTHFRMWLNPTNDSNTALIFSDEGVNIDLELPLAVKKIHVGNKYNGEKVRTLNIVNSGDLVLDQLEFNTRRIMLKGLNSVEYISSIRIERIVYQQLGDFPQSCFKLDCSRGRIKEAEDAGEQYLNIKIDILDVLRASNLKPFKYVKRLHFGEDSNPNLDDIANIAKTMGEQPKQIVIRSFLFFGKTFNGADRVNDVILQKYFECGYELQIEDAQYTPNNCNYKDVVFTLK